MYVLFVKYVFLLLSKSWFIIDVKLLIVRWINKDNILVVRWSNWDNMLVKEKWNMKLLFIFL